MTQRITINRDLLEALAPYTPDNQDEMGGCVHCGGHPPGTTYGYAGRFMSDHAVDCPWMKARKKLGDRLPHKRISKSAVVAGARFKFHDGGAVVTVEKVIGRTVLFHLEVANFQDSIESFIEKVEPL